MSQTWFRFKQFTVHQDRCGMKVTGDACLFGALAAARLPAGRALRILDAGAGTGLLAMMLAQQHRSAQITALELDPEAAAQAAENAAASPFAEQISVVCGDLRAWHPDGLYDVVICNPPFFSGGPRSVSAGRRTAFHDDSLPAVELAAAAARLLAPEGELWVLYPPDGFQRFAEAASQEGLYPLHQWLIRHRSGSAVHRIAAGFSRRPVQTVRHEITVYSADGAYSAGAAVLLRDFYPAL